MSEHSTGETTHGDAINLLDYWRALMRQKLIVGITVGICLGLAITAAALLPRRYSADVIMSSSADQQSSLSSMLKQVGSILPIPLPTDPGSDFKQEAIATFKSRAFIFAFIEENGLLQELFADDWDAEKKAWRGEERTVADGYRVFSDEIFFVTEGTTTGLITVQVIWEDRELATEWANAIVAKLNLHMQDEAVRSADANMEVLEAEVMKTSDIEVKNMLYGMIESQMKTSMLARTNAQYAFKIIDPAFVPAEDDYVFPNIPLLIASGLLAGMFAGALFGIFRDMRQRR